jgi:hypothetical protein
MISRLAYSLLVGTSFASSVEIYQDNEHNLADQGLESLGEIPDSDSLDFYE